MPVARIAVTEVNEKLKVAGSDLQKKLKKQAKITEQMREFKKVQGAPDALKNAIKRKLKDISVLQKLLEASESHDHRGSTKISAEELDHLITDVKDKF